MTTTATDCFQDLLDAADRVALELRSTGAERDRANRAPIGYHYAQTRIARLFGTHEQAEAQSRRNAEDKLFWGGIQNPVVYKAREVGDWALNHRGPEFSLYR
jgi:hypothetical protein